MVFISLEEYVQPFDPQQAIPLPPFELELRKPRLQVIVTPGSPSKPTAIPCASPTAPPKHSMKLQRRFSVPTMSSSSNPSSSGFVMYLIDRTMRRKWIVTTSMEAFLQFRSSMQQVVGDCRHFHCCGPFRRILKSPNYKLAVKSSQRRWSFSSDQVRQSNVMTEYLVDLLESVYARDCACESLVQARRLMDAFLQLRSQQRQVADDILQIHATQEQSPTRSDDDCAICCENLRIDTNHSTNVSIVHGCHHAFHATCLREWLHVQQVCPICRQALNPSSSSMSS